MPDFDLSHHGSVNLLTPLSEEAQEWVEEFLPFDRMEWSGSVVIEPRFTLDLLRGIELEGLEVRCDL